MSTGAIYSVKEWPVLREHALQSSLYRTTRRFPVVCAGRGSGKSETARRRMVRELPCRVPGNDHPEYFYGLPTYNQAKRIAWKHFKRLIPKPWIEDISETNLTIKTVFGSELYVLGFDKPMRAEGTQWVGGMIDESSDEPPGLFDLTIRPALTRWNGWCWRLGVPKRAGVGAKEFKAAYELGLTRQDPDVRTWHWDSESVLSYAEIQAIKRNISDEDYNEQYKARWGSAGGLIFHAFKKELNVTAKAQYCPDQPIVVGSDFNVNPMCWVLCHLAHDGLIAFDEIEKRNTNTTDTLKELKQKYGEHKGGWKFAGDASGKARKSSAFSSDYVQIINFAKTELHGGDGGVQMYYLNSNPPLANRFASCNALLQAADGTVRAYIHPKCKRLIADLEYRFYKPETREPKDSGDLGHMSDAWGYIVYRFFPLRVIQDREPTIIATLSS